MLSNREIWLNERLSEQMADCGLSLGGVAFAGVLVAQVPVLIHQVKGGPVAAAIGTPVDTFIILKDRITDAQLPDSLFQALEVGLPGKFRKVIANNDQTLAIIFFMPAT